MCHLLVKYVYHSTPRNVGTNKSIPFRKYCILNMTMGVKSTVLPCVF
jgi:hypothetical protein